MMLRDERLDELVEEVLLYLAEQGAAGPLEIAADIGADRMEVKICLERLHVQGRVLCVFGPVLACVVE